MFNKRKGLCILALSVFLFSGTTQLNAIEFLSKPDTIKLEQYYTDSSKSSFYVGDIKVTKKLITRNFTNRNSKPKYIVIHDTDNRDSGADIYMHAKYYQNNTRGASAHYTVQDNAIVQSVEDNDSAWHAQDRFNPKINNSNSIGIEMTVHPESDFKMTLKNTQELTKYLMEKYNIPVQNVVRHHDVSGKNCPRMLMENPQLWVDFKRAIGDKEIKDVETITKVQNSRVVTSNAELHDEPSWIYSPLTKIAKGERVEFVEEKETWVKVKFGNYEGWLPNIYVEEDAEATTKKVNEVAVLTRVATLGGQSVGVVPKNSEVQVFGETGEFSRVSYEGNFGYIPTSAIAR